MCGADPSPRDDLVTRAAESSAAQAIASDERIWNQREGGRQ